MGPYTQSYQPMADLRLKFDHEGGIADYRRDLDLSTAVAATRYKAGDVTFRREAFSSYPDQVLAIRVTADRPGRISFTASLDSLHPFTLAAREGLLVLAGKAPTQVDPKGHETAHPIVYDPAGDSVRFECHLRAVADGGEVSVTDQSITVRNANAATLILGAGTSYNGPDKSPTGEYGLDPGSATRSYVAGAAKLAYDDLRARHVAEHQKLFGRVTLDLGASPDGARDLQTDERVNRFGPDDPANVVLHFQYGRYLLISSARPGTLPPNLQGIWNDMVTPPWSSNYTTNINTEMNHWPAEVTNLPECHEPLFAFVESLAKHGAKTAKVMYGCRGWCCHHNSDAWAQTGMPGGYGDGGKAKSALWPMAAPWFCSHLFEHYRFSLDRDFLARAYPTMKGACEFYLDFLVDDGHGHLVTNPSTSPENEFVAPDGKRSAVSMASTMDMALVWDLFTNTMEAGEALGFDPDFRKQLADARAKLFPPMVAPDGRLQEWFKDFKETDPHHRHVSHLWGVYPGRQITPERAPDLFTAARKSLEARGDVATGWSSGWKINLWARFRDGDHAMRLVRRTLRVAAGGVYPNLFGSHPPFQMDGNFAFPAGVAEMLLQSHAGLLHLLPALPKDWPTGKVAGLRARGNFTVGLGWKDGALSRATLVSHSGGPCALRYRDHVADLKTEPGKRYDLSPELQHVE
jgi:alpha-L-fucosidase 2